MDGKFKISKVINALSRAFFKSPVSRLLSVFLIFKVSSNKNSNGGVLDSNCKADCPSLCGTWKTFKPKQDCQPKCPWVPDPSLKVSCGIFN